MRRQQIEALLQDGKATNGGATDFMIQVPPNEMSASLTILKHLEVNGTIASYKPCPPPDTIDLTGYTGP